MSEIGPEKLSESLPTYHTLSRAWCYDHCVSKFTSICVLMYLCYIYLLISAMMDSLSDEIHPPPILRATRTQDFVQGW